MSSAIEIEHLSKSYPKRNGSSVQALTIGLNLSRLHHLVLCADRYRQYGLEAVRRDASRHDGAMVHEARAGWADFVGAHAGIAKTLPSTQGIIVLRRVILDGQSLVAVWQDGSLGWLILHSALYFVGGLLILGCGSRLPNGEAHWGSINLS